MTNSFEKPYDPETIIMNLLLDDEDEENDCYEEEIEETNRFIEFDDSDLEPDVYEDLDDEKEDIDF